MKFLDMIVALLLIIGGLNWGLVGIADLNLVTAIFGVATTVTKVIYILVGIAAIIAIFRCKSCCSSGGKSCCS